jgi:hypothetical protein
VGFQGRGWNFINVSGTLQLFSLRFNTAQRRAEGVRNIRSGAGVAAFASTAPVFKESAMRVKNVNRMFLTVAISVLSIAGTGFSAGSQRQDNNKHDDQKQQGKPDDQQNDKQRGNSPSPQQ